MMKKCVMAADSWVFSVHLNSPGPDGSINFLHCRRVCICLYKVYLQFQEWKSWKIMTKFVCQPETLFPCVWTGDKSAWLVPRPREHEKPPWPSSDSVTEEATSTVASINVFSQKSPRSDNILTFKQKIPVYSGTLRAQHRPSPNE